MKAHISKNRDYKELRSRYQSFLELWKSYGCFKTNDIHFYKLNMNLYKYFKSFLESKVK